MTEPGTGGGMGGGGGRLFEDLSRVANGALGAFSGLRHEVEGFIKQRIEQMLAGMNLVNREEFDAVAQMAALARSEQEAMAERLAALEAKLAALEANRKKS